MVILAWRTGTVAGPKHFEDTELKALLTEDDATNDGRAVGIDPKNHFQTFERNARKMPHELSKRKKNWKTT